jgi:hypothetical protein
LRLVATSCAAVGDADPEDLLDHETVRNFGKAAPLEASVGTSGVLQLRRSPSVFGRARLAAGERNLLDAGDPLV